MGFQKIVATLLAILLPLCAGLIPRHITQAMSQETGSVGIDAERTETFKWLSSLGYPDVKDRPFVHVATGSSVRWSGDPRENLYDFGFLLKDGESFIREFER